MRDLRTFWKTNWLTSTSMDWLLQTGPWNKLAGRLWGFDIDRLWTSIGQLDRDPDGAVVLDVACGGGIAFRPLSSERRVHYVAADISPVMLGRAARLARRRGLHVDLIQLDVEAMPFPDATFDVCVCHGSLHGFPDPAAATHEIGRVLKPGATLRGTTFVLGTAPRRDKLIRRLQRRGVFGPAGTIEDLERWMTDAGFTDVEIVVDGVVAEFSSRRKG